MRRSLSLLLLGCCLLWGCPDEIKRPSGRNRADSGATDAAKLMADASQPDLDQGVGDGSWADSGSEDLGGGDLGLSDLGFNDSGAADLGIADLGPADLGPPDLGPPDLGPPDLGPPDLGPPDLGPPDLGPPDLGPPDLGTPDLGPPDLGTPDLGPPDTGTGTGIIYMDYDYRNASSPGSPRRNYHGFSESQWAPRGSSWPQVVLRFNRGTVGSDPIGNVLRLPSSDDLEIRYGLTPLRSYTRAIVEVQGRSRATSSQVRFEVTNQPGTCGAMGTLSQSWNPQTAVLDITGCLHLGSSWQGFQGLRLSPMSGTIALQRIRLTIEGAVW